MGFRAMDFAVFLKSLSSINLILFLSVRLAYVLITQTKLVSNNGPKWDKC